MSLGAVLFVVFLILKLIHDIDWSWWLVCLPLIIEVGFDVLLITLSAVGSVSLFRRLR